MSAEPKTSPQTFTYSVPRGTVTVGDHTHTVFASYADPYANPTPEHNASYYPHCKCPKCRALNTPQVEPLELCANGVSASKYDWLSQELLEEARQIEQGKRGVYTRGSEDVLANFRRIAEMTGQTPGEVLVVYMMKHVLSVCTALTNPDIKDPEALIGRFADNINYLKLGYTMLQSGLAHERKP